MRITAAALPDHQLHQTRKISELGNFPVNTCVPVPMIAPMLVIIASVRTSSGTSWGVSRRFGRPKCLPSNRLPM